MLTKMISKCSWQLLTVLTVGIVITAADAQYDGPIIAPNMSELILKKGENFTIYCKSNVPIHLRQQDISEEPIGPFNMNQRELLSVDNEYKYEIALDLFNVDEFAVGYYACFDDTFNANVSLNNFMKEPLNTEHVSYIYIYVDETDIIFAPMSEFVRSRSGSKVVIECRPTTPDVNVVLIGLQSNKTPIFEKYSPKIGFLMKARSLYTEYNCTGTRGLQNKTKVVRYNINEEPAKPNIEKAPKFFIEGESFSLNCTVKYLANNAVALSWKYPSNLSKDLVSFDTNEHDIITGGNVILYNIITVVNASKSASGNYTCISNIVGNEQYISYEKAYAGTKGFLKLEKKVNGVIESESAVQNFHTLVDSYPKAQFTYLKNNESLPKNSKKYEINCCSYGSLKFSIRQLTLQDTANYTIIASNKYWKKTVTYDFRKKAIPEIVEFPNYNKKYLLGQTVSLVCKVTGYPLPIVKWRFHNNEGEVQEFEGNNTAQSLFEVTSILDIPVHASGNITCWAKNYMGTAFMSKPFLVYEIPDGFSVIDSEKTWFSQKENVTKTCFASKYDYENVTWVKDGSEKQLNVRRVDSNYSYVAQLYIEDIALEDAGNYTCVGVRNETNDSQTIYITVAAQKRPAVTISIKDKEVKANPYQSFQFSCQADAVPPPRIYWYKDNEMLNNRSKLAIFSELLDHSTVNSTVIIYEMSKKFVGEYKCEAVSGNTKEARSYHLIQNVSDEQTNKLPYLIIIGATLFALILLIVYLAWKIRKDKQFKKELQAAGLINFKKGATKSINPELGIDEQAELLPYNERFEFPPEKLTLGKQLGEGAFGVVYKAEARGIINAEVTTPVAVKMVKKTADNMFIKALASELKIMVHLGKHINIVNLLGACTKKVGKRELIVIVEYCKFGNIHNYMQRHREVFIDQLTDNNEKNLGRVNKAFSSSSASSGMHSDYFGSNHSQETDHTCLNTANTNRSARKVSETGYVQPEWRSNYVSDYNYDDGRSPRPLTSRDLMAWAFQIARGMEYLANRKVLHGDLAARNVLLAEDNIIKICDFGLARSIYKNDEYKKQENSPLPVKWLALECMTDRIFSTQSDVWSFGVVLWELFSLAKNPYPNVSPTSLIQWLSEGHRLEKPRYADDRLYGVMKQCWQQKPTARPSFSQLQEMLGSFLEDNVRNHYVDLNSAYVESNKINSEQEDYLKMVCEPDYNNLVTPSPHHYANDSRSFFPPAPLQLAHDDEGYLQMSPATSQTPFSPRYVDNKFDFDARKLQFRTSDASSLGSELTPMLTLNNLPARGSSESDLDGNVSSYLSMCPRIEEESDDVFETNPGNAKHALNKNSAVSNPTYTFDVDLEKKPLNVSNNYINVNLPNGLVK